MSNAINYSIPGSEITTYCRTENDILCICITNKPQDLSNDVINNMFDRSWQKENIDNSSSQNGLGLALVKSYADLLNLKINTSLADDGILTIDLCGFYQDH
jgi:K+-sensing histidine kinase KdpD